MNRRKLIKKGIVLGIVAMVILGMIPSQSQANLVVLNELIQEVDAMNLHAGLSNSFDAKIAAALRAKDNYNANDKDGVMNALDAFVYVVEAQRGKNILEADANYLLYLVDKIIKEFGCCSNSPYNCDIPDCQCNFPCIYPCVGSGI